MALLAKDGAKPNGTCFRRYRTDLIKIGGLILVSFVLFTLLNVVSAESDSDLTFDDSINELLSGAAESSEKDDPVKSGHHRVTKAQGVEHHVHHHHAAGPHSKKKHHVVKSRTRRKGPPSRHAKTRVPAFSDDEDFLSDSWGGSGSGDDVITPEPTRPHVHHRPTDPPIRPKLRPTEIDLGDPDSRASIVFFRVTLTLLDRPFEPELVDRNSNGFRRLSDELRQEMERVFDAIPGTRDITPVSFAPTNSGDQILVTFDIGSTNHDERDMKERIKRYVDYGTIGRLKVSPDRFSVTRYGAPQYPACRETEFTCQDGECVPLNSRCDGRNDCRDASDEYNCLDSSARECTYTEFKCGSGECLDVRRRCDRSRDCQDGSDEDRCPSEPPRGHTCRPGEFLCDGRRCIPESSRCNNAIDCIDRTDEANCTSPASPRPGPSRECDGTTEFRCSSGECIESFRQCDLVPDCPNAEDETYCRYKTCLTAKGQGLPCENAESQSCSVDGFQCDDASCIDAARRCDRNFDCPDRSDENNCPDEICEQGKFRCENGTCIDVIMRCDGEVDCPDGSDEMSCPCPLTQWQCDMGLCVDRFLRCNGIVECPTDDSDERGCPTPTQCTSSQFRCSDGTCIPSQNRCNGIVDCRDGSDERVCRTHEIFQACRSDQFQCNNTYCIPSRKKCDGYSDCQDGTDEKNCPGPCANNEFRCTDGTCLPDGVRCNRRLDCLDGSDEADCRPSRCRFDQFRCTDGTCLKIDQRCNGIPECSGSEDEAGCPGPNRCGATQFQCRDGYCISATKRCDRRTDCPDSSDEIGCDPTAPPPPPPVTPPPRPACKATDFICSDGACVNQTSKCDGKYDCRTGDDEIICRKCERSEFTCNNGQCVDSRRRCDGSRDCSSGEDEAECPPSRDCQPTDVICRDGTCLDARKRCDNVRDCPDGIDEENCIRDCLSSEFRCGDGSCINATRKCDRNPDCKDGSDEVGCGTCTWHQFRCSELICVDKQRRCNGQPECFDFSDEINCACNSSQFSCDNGQCVDKYRYCDRQFDCFDRSDERYNCRKLCAANDFVCADGACVDRAKKCDGIADCRDRSDESGCACAPNEFRCRNGECIHRSKRCDRRVDCADHSDEGNCPIIPVCGNITEPFYCTRTGRCIPKSKVCDGVTDCADYSDESNCGSCRSDQLACGDGTCISPSQRCNGRRDCRDASDESNCPSPKECAPNETKCRSGECIHQSKRCDGRVDCSDYSDEGNCAGFEKPSCGDAKYFFMCASVKRCVPRVSVCDKIPDCPDYSDELNCVACRSDQLACGDGTCVLPSQRCNGKPDCPDGSDELNCPFTACNGTFRCSNGTCLPQTLVCDGTAHCQPHAEDEKNCGCANYTDPFVCVSDGKCIHKQNLCDSVPDCIDYSDEAACDVCRSDQLPCGDGTCINPSDRCNGQVDCRDGSDEFNCLLPDCNSTSFRCGNGSCIAQARICDGRVDCHPNGDDERSCGCSNITDPFICDSNQKCILRSQVCDGVANCADYSDESKCDACRTDQLACGDGTCISLSQRCNGRPDCRDNSDEVNCPIAVCHPISQFRCKSGECVDLKFHCDGVAHCRDSSDEYHCYGACSSGEHLCGEGRCVKTYRVCDGRKDCLDGSDEYDCHNRGPHHHGCNGSTTTQFRCEFGYQCVDIRRRCDGRYDCRDYSDERNCGCSRGEFRCGDGRCVDQRRHCDGRRDCSDGSDETLCDCPPNHLLCDEGRCVPLIQKCDGVRHCRDNKDEIDCPGCRSNELACGDGACIALRQRCDGKYDCRDASDEQNCPRECDYALEHRCGNGKCINRKRKCDGVYDCLDRSDEYNCSQPECRENEYRCRDGRCIDSSRRCNGYPDCGDGLDEFNCTCSSNEFRCDDKCLDNRRRCDGIPDCRNAIDELNCDCSVRCDGSRCLSRKFKCDGVSDCLDGTDELDCPKPPSCHPIYEHKCGDGRCVSYKSVCNKKVDCLDASDEYGCDERCGPSAFRCRNGNCIPSYRRCDGYVNCADHSDETGCACLPGQFRCSWSGRCIDSKMRCDGKDDCPDRSDEALCGCNSTQFRCDVSRCVDLASKCDGRSDCNDLSDELDCVCPLKNQFRCGDGRCIPIYQKCNGIQDCYDFSDEIACVCGAGQFRCNDGRCVDYRLRCNRRYDCYDRSDERNCPGVNPQVCRSNEFRCRDGSCVDIRRRCDKRFDCPDYSDETDCGRPPADASSSCRHYEFRCLDGTCVDSRRRCDGRIDCRDYSDEIDCRDYRPSNLSQCRPDDQFRCADGACIDLRRRCDNRIDCNDYSDEVDCQSNGCSSNEFRCRDGRCIDSRRRCDRRFDCRDYSDEMDCRSPPPGNVTSCRSDQFQCLDGVTCIDLSRKCDSRPDCQDYSDERDCTTPSPACNRYQFRCRSSGQCVDVRRRCDRRADCPDRSDEDNCNGRNATCVAGQFQCDNLECVRSDVRCDRKYDCSDGSDERGCSRPTCSSNEFQCNDGSCIESNKHCNRQYDCADRSDEFNCGCQPNQYQCASGECVAVTSRCDGRPDCRDRSDEIDCDNPCDEGMFQCGDGTCIDDSLLCDGLYDCVDFGDEQNCESRLCRPSQFRCSTGLCIDRLLRCDQNVNCHDQSDELDCWQCLPNQYHCANGQCIERYQRCNGKYDCADYSDEADCDPQDGGYNVRVYPERQTIRQGREVVFRCRDEGPRRSPVKWSRADARSMPPSSRDVRGRLTMPSIQPEHAGTYICSAISAPQGVLGAQKVATLTVQPSAEGASHPQSDNEDVPPTTRPVRPPGICQRSEATCKNGECIPREYVCDGDFDCTDQSDESSCGYKVRCEPSEFQCDNQKCVLKVWRCDGENDCGDNSDEKSCKPNHPESACRYDEFQCQSGDQCIPKSFHCDGELDCQDNSDEVGCTAPTITQPPPDTLTVAEGETAVITCVAVGKPTPVISWRLNWGHIPSSPRVTTKSENGQGTVTIRDSRKTDGGAWSCEAINSKDSIIATPDCILVIKPKAGLCQPPLFNDVAETPNECLKCFCFGITSTCYSSNLYLTNISLDKDLSIRSLRKERDGSYEDVSSQYPANQDAIDFEPSSKEYSIDERVRQNIPQGIYFYWSLPQEFLGNQLHSYGGYLRFTFRYKSQFIPRPPRVADVILKGNGITLYHVYKKAYGSERDNNPEVRFWEGDWHKDEAQVRGDVPLVDPTTREDIMMVLQNLDSVLIRAIYDEENVETSLSNLRMDTATLIDKNSGIAVYVEKCSCPPGYTGSSCENCAIGYNRRASSGYLGECVPTTVTCNCNQHSDLCDPSTGECLNCQHNTEGRSCERCRKGYYGDAIRGTCQPCPCPRITPPNQFSPTCVLASDGEVTCDACPIGYEGRGCERCAPGYEGNPNQPGSQCQPKGRVQCDPVGSLTSEPSPTTGLCQCKPYATGSRCDQCKPNTYYLNPGSPSGCIDCFCMGITKACTSSAWYRDQVTLSFANNPAGVVLTDLQRKTTIDRDLSIDQRTMELTYRNFVGKTSPTFYWQLPRDFLGSKVVAYGGTLNYTVRYEPGRLASTNNDPDVQLVGNGITMIYRHRERLRPNILQTISIPMFESYWLRSDGQPTNREHLLMAIANISEIFIKATYTADTLLSSLHSVSMETATETPNGRERALAVEQCRCPTGYKGLSCEDCDSGYTRSGAGLYLGLCDPCICNGHSSDCDPEVGTCRNCQHNTAGEYCQECAPGYVGTATDGSPNDCRPQENDTGGLGCNCDRRGSVGFDCDYRTKSCRCKSNVQGRNCNSCKDGHFNLDASNPEGCASCFCFNITNQCTSSSYYRDQIRMQLRDLRDLYSHSFQVTNRYRSRTLTEGIVVNPNLNEMSFTGFPQETDAQETFYWSLPAQFLGNRLASYGGRLVYTQSYTANPDGEVFNDADVEIIGNGISIFYVNNPPLRNRETRTFEIDLQEKNWQIVESFGPTAAKREHFMKVLANVEALLIRASFNRRVEQSKLRDIMMDTANPQATGQGLATQVEQCNCPPGYIGLSCQECAPGYIRDSTGSGPGLGRCTRCNCNGHSESCDATTGRCVRCRDNTMGDNCERCVEGFYGDATRGTPEDCKPCPCPLTVPSNQFSRTCNLDTDGQPTCNACPVGYVGRLCEACAQNYRGNPLQIGSRCEPSRGTVQTIRVRVEGPLTQRVAAGGSVTFRCSGVSQVSDVSYTLAWTKEGGEFPSRRSTEASGVLTIVNVRPEDSGTYVCTGSDLNSVDQKKVTLIVEGAGRTTSPRVRIEPSYLSVNIGDPVEFQCIAEGFPEPELQWTGGRNNQLNPQSTFVDGIFRIPSARKSDEAEYFCSARNSAGAGSVRTVLFVKGDRPPVPDTDIPRVSVSPASYDAQPGETVTLECRVTGSPTPVIGWTFSNGPLPSTSSQNGGVLLLPRVTLEHSGDYVCTATNIHGTAREQTRLLVSQGRGPPTARVEPERQTLIQGSSGEMRCVSSGNPKPTVTWSKVGGTLSPRHKSLQGDTLLIEDVVTEDRGLYVCKAENPDGTAQASSIVEVERREVPAIELYPESTQAINRGGSILFQCRVSAGIPTPLVDWTRADGSPFTSNTEILNGGVIRFNRVTGDEEGVYICTAENLAGRVTAQANLQVLGSPSLRILQSSPYRVRVNERVRLECQADGDPQPNLSWYKLQQITVPMSAPAQGADRLAVLEINRVSPADGGTYACRATSSAGQSEERIQLIVEDTDSIVPEIVIEDRVTSVSVGNPVRIRCFVRGQTPDVRLSWSRPDDKPLPSGHRVEDGVLFIPVVNQADEGEYICTGSIEGAPILTAKARLAVVAPPRIRVYPPKQYAYLGDVVRLQCSASGDQPITVHWNKLGGSPLGPSVVQAYGLLEFRGILLTDSGRYLCTAVNAAGKTEGEAEIIVKEAQPLRREESTYVGQTIELVCPVATTPAGSYRIDWTKENTPLPDNAEVINNRVRIRNARLDNGGRYICNVVSRTGRNRDFVQLNVKGKRPCGSREFRCQDGTCIDAKLHCDRLFHCLDFSDEVNCVSARCSPGQFACLSGGVCVEAAKRCDRRFDCPDASDERHCDRVFRRSDVPTIEVRIEPSKEMVSMGDSLTLRCRVSGTRQSSTAQWSKVEHEGQFPDNVQVRGNVLTINGVKAENGGVYRCTLDSHNGSFSDSYVLAIQVTPSFNPDEVETRAAPLGSTMVLDCENNLDGPVAYTWSKQGAAIRSEAVTRGNSLTIPKLSLEDAGIYICTAKSDKTTMEIPTIVVITGTVPKFVPGSYMQMKTLPNAYSDFDVEVYFKPEEPNGLILFNGQDGGGDFISLGLSDGHVEFRLELGSGPAVIRSQEPVQMGIWHTARIIRKNKDGTLYVDDQPPVKGEAQGRFLGLDLSGPLYIGGVPSFGALPKQTGFASGFVGCVSKLKIKQTEHDLMLTAEDHGTTVCEGCVENPCLHGGVCQEALTATGYLCICPPGFSGQECEKVGEACYPGVCGEGRCVNKPGGGFDCYCPFGRTGLRCEREIVIFEPSFSDDAFVAYPKPSDVQRQMVFDMKIKPRTLDDGIILYCGQDSDGSGDFTSLTLKNKTIEFRFDTGSGPAVIRSPAPIQADQWVNVRAERDAQDGKLSVNGGNPVTGRSPGHTKGLNLGMDLFVGGVDKRKIKVSELVGVNHGFDGCVAHMEVNDVKIDLVSSVIDASNVDDCGSHTACDTNPCKNGGRCQVLGNAYKCVCPEGFRGRNCDNEFNLCDVTQPCKNGASCHSDADGYKCKCPLGFKGKNCEDVTKFDKVASFRGDGYVALEKSLSPPSSGFDTETIRVSFMTNHPNGLVFFHGQRDTEDGKDRDYVALAVVNGHLEFSYELGSGPAVIKSSSRVNDGKSHNVIIQRTGTNGKMELDGSFDYGSSQGILQSLNAEGDIYIGGVPEHELMTGDRYPSGFVGCVWGVEIQNSGVLDLYKKAKSGANVLPCGDNSALGDSPFLTEPIIR